jgi:glycosyltransferase involved in cell wall biosynthesis
MTMGDPVPNDLRPLRVALFTDADVFAGTERHMLDLARGLRAAGMLPSLVSPRVSVLADRAAVDGIPHIAVEKGGFIDRPAIRVMRGKLRSGEIDVIHAHNGRTALIAALAVKLERRGTYVLTQHFLIPSRATRTGIKGFVSNALHRWISRGAGHIIAISDASRRGIEERGESATGNVTTVPNGISAPDLAKLTPPAEVRAALGIAPGRPLIVCAARLEKEKDVASLIAAMPSVVAAVPNAVCVVAGDGSERAERAAQIQTLGLNCSVMLAGFREDAMSIIHAADLFVLPSLAEPFGLVLIEAMSLGKPIISTDAGGPREIVENGRTGILVPPATPDALGGAIERLLLDEKLRLSMGTNGRKRFEEHYTLPRMTAGIIETYRKALGGGAPARTRPRVLLISHTCQTRAEGQPKAAQLARLDDIDLMVLTPRRFNHFGVWKDAETPVDDAFQYAPRNVMWGWLGPAQNYLHWYPSLAGILRDFQPDIIDLWEEPWALVSAHACWLRNRILPNARILMETEQNISKAWPPPFRWLESYTIRNAAFAVGRSEGAVEVLRGKGYAGPARVVGNAVDTELFRPMDREACKRSLGFDGYTVGYIGRMVERKGLIDMIEALRHCTAPLTMVFVGSGEYEPALRERVTALGFGNRVRFLPARPLEELPPVMNALDAFILPSWTVPTWKEQFGRVIIEAHACKTPVIGSDSGAIPGVIGEGGIIFPERDPEKLAAAMMRLQANPSLGREMGAAGLAQVEACYTWAQVAARMRGIYFECLGGAPGASIAPSSSPPSLIECP